MRSGTFVALALCSWLAAGCGAAPRPALQAPSPAASPAPGPPAVPEAPPQESLLEYVPSSAGAALVVRRNALALLPRFLASSPEMREELRNYLMREIGIDLTRIEGLVAYSTNLSQQVGAVFLRLPEARSLRGRPAGSYGGVNLVELVPPAVAAVVKGGVVLGAPTQVAAAIDLAAGRIGPAGPGSLLAGLSASDVPGVDIAIGLHVGAVTDPSVTPLVQQFGVRSALLTYRNDGLVTLRIEGDGSKLGAVSKLFGGGAQVALMQLEQVKDKAVAAHDVSQAVGAIVGFHQAEALFREIAPRLEGNALVSRYQVPKLDVSGMVFVYAGLASAVAIPAFVKYIRRSKAAEARQSLAAIAAAVRGYHEEHRRRGRRFAFPPSVSWSPAIGCCHSPPSTKCQPDPQAFAHPAWQAFHFAMSEPHYYQYRFTSQGRGRKARFVAEAKGDLDCNGVFSLYRIEGHIDRDGSLVVEDLTVKDELE